MNIEEFRNICLSHRGVTEEFPFDDQTLVYKVRGRIFALADVDYFESINIKCDPEEAIELREHYPAVTPGFHMNKKHWNTVKMDNGIPDELVCEWIKKSYELVVRKLPVKIRRELKIETDF